MPWSKLSRILECSQQPFRCSCDNRRLLPLCGIELCCKGRRTPGSWKMKWFLAAIALICLSSTVLAHDIYSGFRDRNGHLCCNGQDCRPVEATVLPDGSYYLPASDETIPADMATPSPDDRFHHCIYYPFAGEFLPWGGPTYENPPMTRCFFAPMTPS